MFELRDTIVEQILFAMEDQENASVIDIDSGEVLPFQDGENYVPPPSWSSREGFRLMEDFLASVRQPSARRDLGAALARGRGVFKAFKAALAEYPDLERSFRDFKLRAMRRTIATWYDDLREVRGLERLGPEPEETYELIVSDLDIRLEPLAQAKAFLPSLFDEAESESLDYLPSVVAGFEFDRLRDEMDLGHEGLCALADDGEGGAIGAALAYRIVGAERSIGRIVFLFVRKEFRRMGLGKAMLGVLTDGFRAEGTHTLILDSALVPYDFATGLERLGYRPYGARALHQFE
ncbi:MAG TPA: GNAT family N-acetyltransferase [Rectinemataceae bacterium]|nr:GNAT family N-acetyltransferase [Rectinemataceae bacterium]